jgi:choline-sulfatase
MLHKARAPPISRMLQRPRDLTAFALAAALLAGCGGGEPLAGARPNILFVLADDLRWDALGVTGNPTVLTPELDALARGGHRFDAFYVASPVCQAARLSFLTGLYPHQAGVDQSDRRLGIGPGVGTLATHLREAGYVSGFVGKGHLLGDPASWGFDESPFYIRGRMSGQEWRGPEPVLVDGHEDTIEGHATGRLIDAAIGFVERHRDERWLLWLAPSAPHFPYTPQPDFPYRPREVEVGPGFPPRGEFEPVAWAGYYSLIGQLDHELGRLFARLDALGLSDDTLVLVTSDNGLMHGSHGLPGKAVWYDEATRVPALLRWPGRVAPGSSSAALVSSVDLLPTLLVLAGLPPPQGLEGRSFLPVLRGQPVHPGVYAEIVVPPARRSWAMVRDEHYKLAELGDGRMRLYDLERDPHELENVVTAPAHAELALALEARLQAWERATP